MSRGANFEYIELRPVAGALGAEISGVDTSRPIPSAVVDEIRAALDQFLVIFFCNQELSLEQLKSFSACFGELSRVPYVGALEQHPEIIAVIKEANERNISTFGGTWHTDFSFLERPPVASILYAEQVPEIGGDTIWANMYAAYAALTPGMQRTLEGLNAMHSGHVYGAARPPIGIATSTSIHISRNNPEADVERPHPVVRLNPRTRERALYVNPVYTTRFENMTEEESLGLLDFLYIHCTRAEFTCRFRWAPGSIAVWDNRYSLHLAVNDYDGQRRCMYRTSTAGEAPVGPGDD
ncbi:MAG: taurine dioxygenase [Lysobacterales bacterium]|nr:MAG: taurine dioxygenase [Xanthomonadales bacterium]